MKQACLLLPALLLSACSLRTAAVRTTAAAVERGMPAFYGESDPDYAREAAPAELKLLETFLENDPANPRLLRILSEGFSGYAFLFLEDAQPDRAARFYQRSLAYALRLCARNASLKALDTLAPETLDSALRKAGFADVPGLYWTAFGQAGWANLAKSDADALAGLPRAAKLMARVLELDPGYQYGGADLWFGMYYSVRPKMAGGDLEKAKAHFEAALARTQGRFLTGKLLYAQHYAVGALDEELFKKLLSEVLEAPADALPQARLANEIAKRKAKALLEKTNDLF